MDSLKELFNFVRAHGKWILVPMLLIFFLFGALLLMSETVPAVSSFIYTLF